MSITGQKLWEKVKSAQILPQPDLDKLKKKLTQQWDKNLSPDDINKLNQWVEKKYEGQFADVIAELKKPATMDDVNRLQHQVEQLQGAVTRLTKQILKLYDGSETKVAKEQPPNNTTDPTASNKAAESSATQSESTQPQNKEVPEPGTHELPPHEQEEVQNILSEIEKLKQQPADPDANSDEHR